MYEIKSVYELILTDQAQADQLTKSIEKAKDSDFIVRGLFRKALKTWRARAEKKVKPPTVAGRIPEMLVAIKFWSQPSTFRKPWVDGCRISYPKDISLDVVIWSAGRELPVSVELRHQPRLYQEKNKHHDLTKSGLMFQEHNNLEKLGMLQSSAMNGEVTLYLVAATTEDDSPVFVIYGFHKDVPGSEKDVSHLVPDPKSTFPDFHSTLPFHPQAQLVYANPETKRGFVSRAEVTWDDLRHLCQSSSNVLVATVCKNLPNELRFDRDTPREEEDHALREPPKTAVTGRFNWWRKKFEKDVGKGTVTKSGFR